MRLIIVSGLSGSGKTVALRVLEDLGYYCIDNIPVALLHSAVREIRSGDGPSAELLAVGVDARSGSDSLHDLPALLATLRDDSIRTDIIFLHAADNVLLKRYSESRRRHPLAEHGSELRKAIASEREILTEIQNDADLIIDTSTTSIYELADVIRERVDRRQSDSLSVLIESFGFKHGIPADADFVFDLRCLPNPYWSVELRGLTGLDEEVVEFLHSHDNFTAMYQDIVNFLDRWIPQFEIAHRGYLTVAIGCTGGQHRSVCMVEKLATELRRHHAPVLIRHNNLPDHRIHPD
ncbi:MAG: RNase adapter RapZ [Gammaproteobacteria bacterium]|nr:RNase adapter RapZ [Gammaproteobacteria bacterium]